MNLNPKHLVKILEINGFVYNRSKGHTSDILIR